MLQVDENIGGRQDQKNNGLRTKMLAVGLLMVVGCFVVGLFSATAGSTTAHTRGVSSPTGNSCHIYKTNSFAKVYSIQYPQSHSPQNSCIFFFSNTTCHSLRQSRWHGLQFSVSLRHYYKQDTVRHISNCIWRDERSGNVRYLWRIMF